MAALTDPNTTDCTQPVRMATRPRVSPRAGVTPSGASVERHGGAIRVIAPSRPGSGSARPSGARRRAARSRRGYGSRANRPERTSLSPSGRRTPVSIAPRVASTSWSYFTPEGHDETHAMQPRQRSKCVTKVGERPTVPSSRASISWILPRGESISSLHSW